MKGSARLSSSVRRRSSQLQRSSSVQRGRNTRSYPLPAPSRCFRLLLHPITRSPDHPMTRSPDSFYLYAFAPPVWRMNTASGLALL
jgi:hypothetical protein